MELPKITKSQELKAKQKLKQLRPLFQTKLDLGMKLTRVEQRILTNSPAKKA